MFPAAPVTTTLLGYPPVEKDWLWVATRDDFVKVDLVKLRLFDNIFFLFSSLNLYLY